MAPRIAMRTAVRGVSWGAQPPADRPPPPRGRRAGAEGSRRQPVGLDHARGAQQAPPHQQHRRAEEGGEREGRQQQLAPTNSEAGIW